MRSVVKVGGSLLDWPELGPQLRAWLATQTDTVCLLPGGGAAAELVRHSQRTHGLSDVSAHWLAIRAMQFNAALLNELVPGATLCGTLAELNTLERRYPALLDPWQWLHTDDRAAAALPATWDVTSDAIAAQLAKTVRAELTLLKSALPPARTINAAAEAGYVDGWLASTWAGPIRCVNLRAAGWPEAVLRPNDEV